jgi:preprotein translocase subunit SecG
MSLLVVIIHVIVCIALIMIVLLQTGKGADMGAAFGGGASQTLFGATGASTFLSKATTAAAVIFMLTSLVLAYMASDRPTGSLMSDEPAVVEQQAGDETPTATPQANESGDSGSSAPTSEAQPSETTSAPADDSSKQE